jgi:hypothetical protein
MGFLTLITIYLKGLQSLHVFMGFHSLSDDVARFLWFSVATDLVTRLQQWDASVYRTVVGSHGKGELTSISNAVAGRDLSICCPVN